MKKANSSHIFVKSCESFEEWRARKIIEFSIGRDRFSNPVRSYRSRIRPRDAEPLRHHDDLLFYIGDRIYSVIQDFVGQPIDVKAITNAVQQTLLSIDRQQGIYLDTHIFLLMNERTRNIEVRLGERCDLENLYGDLTYVKIIEIDLPYERRKSILELPNGLPPIGGVPWRG